jgi:hypothetical protein
MWFQPPSISIVSMLKGAQSFVSSSYIRQMHHPSLCVKHLLSQIINYKRNF